MDRYGAYKSLAKDCDIVLAYCRAHVRRDFPAVSNNWPQHSDWAMEWVALIGNLYHLNNSRPEVLEHPEKFAERDRELRRAVDEMAEKKETERKDEKTHYACKKVLDSLDNHWEGLTVFVDHPEIPMITTKRKDKCAARWQAAKTTTAPVPNGAVDWPPFYSAFFKHRAFSI